MDGILQMFPESGNDAAKAQGIPISTVDPTNGQVLVYNSTTRQYEPGAVTPSAASETVSGIVELATDAETQTGTDTSRAIVPSSLSAWWTNIKTLAQTFAGNLTLNGTANVANNQLASSGGALMTRDLVDRRMSPSFVYFRDDFLYGSGTGGYGETRWDASAATIAYQQETSFPGHPGTWLLTTAVAGNARFRKTAGVSFSSNAKSFEYIFIVKLAQITNIRAGFGGNNSTSIYGNFNNFVFDDAVSGNWYFAGASTGYAATTGWVFLRAWRYATSGNVNYEIRASENGTVLASGNVADIATTTSADFGMTINSPAGQTSACYIDFAALWMEGYTR